MPMVTVKKEFPLKAGKSADRLSSFDDLPPASGIKCLFPDGAAEIPFRFETGDLLWISTDNATVSRVCYSYETKNIYYGSPLTGAILIGNYMDLTGLGPDDVDKFAEFLSCYSGWDIDIKKFKLTSSRNLLNALLSNSFDNNKQILRRLEKVIAETATLLMPMYFFTRDLLQNIQKSDPNAVILSRVEFVNGYKSSLSDNKYDADVSLAYENVLTLANRYPGLVEIKGDKLVISEEAATFFNDKYGIDLHYGYSLTDPTDFKENAKVDRFLKRVLLLSKWCKEIK